MNYGDLLRRVPLNLKKLFREKESLETKLIQRNWSRTFNEKCLKENIDQ